MMIGCITEQEAHQLVEIGEMLHHSQFENLQTFCESLVVILHQTVAELFDYLLAGLFTRLYTLFSYIWQPMGSK